MLMMSSGKFNLLIQKILPPKPMTNLDWINLISTNFIFYPFLQNVAMNGLALHENLYLNRKNSLKWNVLVTFINTLPLISTSAFLIKWSWLLQTSAVEHLIKKNSYFAYYTAATDYLLNFVELMQNFTTLHGLRVLK